MEIQSISAEVLISWTSRLSGKGARRSCRSPPSTEPRTVRIFGSVARGEADSASDLDLLVEMEPGRSLLDLGGLLMELQDLLGCRVDVVTEKGLRNRIRDRVLKDAVAL
jgi:predicted nucleotidyltransferase